MAKPLTPRKRKQILADYTEEHNYEAVARKHGVSGSTVRKLVLKSRESQEFTEMAERKKTEIETDILKHMEGQRDKVCMIIDKYLDALMDDEKIAAATTNQLTTAMGTLIDKFLMSRQTEDESGGGLVEIPAVLPMEEVQPNE